MAINPLYGYDTGVYGYGQANTPGGQRKYPAWMTDPNARGIGLAERYAPTAVSAIDIPRGNGLGGFNDQSAPPQQPVQQQTATGWQPTYGAEGGGLEGQNNQTSQALPGWLADFIGGLGGGTSQSGYGIEVAPAGYGGGIAGEVGTPGFGGGTATSGSTGSTGFGGGPAGEIGALGGIDGGGDIGGDVGGMGGGDPGAGGMGGMYRGGVVTGNKLAGPNPAGPDDGYVAMNKGEGVITAAAMKHYGPGFLARLNKLQVPKGASKR